MAPPTHRPPRLYIERDLDGASLSLDEREAHYLGHVLRLARGDGLIVFNGRGTERFASVTSLQRRGAALDLGAPLVVVPESPLGLTLIQALPKSDAMDLIVQKTTELGVCALVPVFTEFSVVRLDAERGERRLEHWHKVARSACEQCGRHRPPRIDMPATLADALERVPPSATRWALDPAAERVLDRQPEPEHELIVAIGPEGGFGPTDWQRLEAAEFQRVALGPRILRAETAAFAVCAIAQSCWGDL